MKRIIALLLCLCTVLTLCTGCEKNDPEPTPAPQESDKPVQPVYELTKAAVSKEETVYVNLSPDGTVRKISVTDKLHTKMPQVRIQDKSDLRDISDVKTFIEPVYENGKMYWDMQSTDLYYNGSSDKELPLGIKVQYLLDGKEISYTDIAGKSGEVEMNITVENRLTETVKLNGRKYTVQCPMLFLCGMLLPEESFPGLSTDKGVILGDGSHKLVFFAGVPGMNESLGLNELGLDFLGDTLGGSSYSLKADAESFSVGNLMFAAIPFSSVRALGFKDISVGVDGLKDMLSDIGELMGAVSSLGLTELIQLLYGDAAQIEKLINSVADAAEIYESNKALIEVLNKYVTEGNLEKLERVITDMERIDTSGIEALADFEPFSRLVKLLGSLDRSIGGLAALTSDYLDIVPLLSSLSEELKAAEVKNAVDALPQTLAKLRELVDILRDSEELITRTAKLFDSEGFDKMRKITELLSGSTSLDALSAAQSHDLAARMQAWLDLGESYDIFTQRTKAQSSSVIFVFKTDAIV